MDALKKLILSSDAVSAGASLSPEYWLSKDQVNAQEDGLPLSQLVEIHRKTSSAVDDTWLVLDTGNTDRGLLNLRGNESKGRTSQKKLVPEGAVIVSRLRPYLKQVAYLPRGTAQRLGKQATYCSTEFYVLMARSSKESIAYLVPWLLSDQVQSVFAQATTGGHHPRFDEELLEQLTVPKAWHKARNNISKEVESAVEAHLNAQLQLATLVAKTAG